ncbi:MAG: hypothetical protein A2X99_10265 [Deltaproteobacteria bacterium GWB2_55_19]|nr:MAG: hypothetical protein A2X99_10265 [Deltaproteobacteria bacterium GWB2_55_19]HAO93409.1 hypothetical protein [Deltaproteobacteria bacterium]
MQVDELKTVSTDGSSAGDDGRVSFQPEQQAKVQELIDEAYRKAYAKASKRSSTEEFERLKTEVERLREERKAAVLLRSISRHGVVDAEEVAELLKRRIRLGEGNEASVTNDSGAAMVNSMGGPLSVDEFVSAWLSERPHHLRPAAGAGAGSLGARFSYGERRHNLSDPLSWRNMPREELDRLLKDGVNVQGSAGQSYGFRDVKNPFLEARRRKFQSAV